MSVTDTHTAPLDPRKLGKVVADRLRAEVSEIFGGSR